MVKLGTQEIKGLYLGGQKIQKAHLGGSLVLGTEKKPSRLPEGYTEVEYVQSDGASWFDLGVKPSKTMTIEMDVEPLVAGAASPTKHFAISYLRQGSGTSTVNYYFDMDWGANGAMGRMGGYTGTKSAVSVVNDNSPRRMYLSLNSINKSFGEGSRFVSAGENNTFSASMPNIKILGNSTANGLKAKLYTLTRFDGNSTLRNNLVPCINPSGVVGLYDLVGAKFYGNAGTGTLTAGPAV